MAFNKLSTITSLYRPCNTLVGQRCLNTSQFLNQNFSTTSDNADKPVEMENPFVRPKTQCLLCKYSIEVNYKNPRLLSQFVSPFTGTIYEKNVTGLCDKQHQLVQHEIKRSRGVGLMPRWYRDPKYKDDPKLFNPFKPIRPNPF